jgi:hypothetical protein
MPPGLRPQNLNDIFQAAAAQTRQKLPELTSNQKVGSFRTLCSITIHTSFSKPLTITGCASVSPFFENTIELGD